jgi:hypothetical protein
VPAVGDSAREAGEVGLDLITAFAQANPATAVAAGLVEVIRRRKARKQVQWLVAVVKHHDSALEDLKRALDSEQLVELIATALAAADEAHTDEKVLLLADITGEAIRPEASSANADTGQYLIDVVARLEAADIKVLRILGSPRVGTGQFAGRSVVGGLTREDLSDALPELGESSDVALARLAAAGMIEDTATGRYGGVGTPESLGPTRAGVWVLSALERVRNGGAAE